MKLESVPLDAATEAAFAHLLDPLRGIEIPDPTGYYVLVLQYIRPESRKTAGGGTLYLPEVALKEDVYQGRCGLVLAVGPDAYLDPKFISGRWCDPGDVVVWPPLENASTRLKYGQSVLALIADDKIILTGADPALATGG